MTQNPYRGLPSVDALASSLETGMPRRLAVAVARRAISQARADLEEGESVDLDAILAKTLRQSEADRGMEVINATGVLLHTNLGRAPWSDDAIDRAVSVGAGYSTVELDIHTGDRGRRGSHAETLLTGLTGAPAALVVNNNAASLLLALAGVASGKAVPVARGELIEIGGSYRLPDVMAASGARLVEVGTTNRTRVGDYLTALQTHDCGAILKVHPSNYRVEGFTEEATISELAQAARRASVPLLYDLGSGLLDAEAPWLPKWLDAEPGARQALSAGADLVMFSGDKLLGGPQAGVIVGDAETVARLRSHPLARALRVDSITYSALAATLEAYLEGPPTQVPFWQMALTSRDALMARAEALANRVDGVAEKSAATVGAGSAPGAEIPSAAVRVGSRQDLFECLLEMERPILARRETGDLVLDLIAVSPDQDDELADAVVRCR